MTNFDLSLHVFEFFKQSDIEEIVVCAGARNAPIVLALKSQNFKVYSFFEERSAAFFAMGKIKSTKKPVAIITTSGTAVAELLPATIESFYQGLPLVLVTADRPKKYRGTGSPQSIEQIGIFSSYVENIFDLDVQTQIFDFEWSQKKPIHLNVSFDEPLIDKPNQNQAHVSLKIPKLNSHAKKINYSFKSPLIIVGEINENNIALVVDFITKTKAPVYAESLSHLKNINEVQPYLLQSSDTLIKKLFLKGHCDAVIRIGGVPTLRFWRDLEQEFHNVAVLSFSDLPFTGLARVSEMTELTQLKIMTEFSSDKLDQIKKMDALLESEKEKLLNKYPLSEPSLTAQLSRVINKAPIYLGNSLPIRNWDQFANCTSEQIAANRGANGIDGQISTYLGWSEKFRKSFCYIGDLTAMYDLASLGLKSQLNKSQRNIIVCNNFGGQIFNRVFKNNDFINSHNVNFNHWAQMWGWDYLQVKKIDDLEAFKILKTDFNIIELLPDSEQTRLFCNEWDEACQKL